MSNFYHVLSSSSFTQDWTNTGLIAANDNWDSVPSIIGYRGDDVTSSQGVDPQTLLGEGTVTIDVNHDKTDPNTFSTGGVTEFQITNPVVALAGSNTADAPYLLIHLNTLGVTNINISYILRDLENGTDNAIQQVALQYRVGTSGNFTNIPAAYISDASSGPSVLGADIPVSVTLPAAAENQSQVQVRIITTNASGNDEWIGIDNINISATSGGGDTTPPTIATLSPADNATAVVVSNNLQVTFDENVQKGTTGNIIIKKSSDNSVVETIAVTSAQVTVSGSTVTINPTNDLVAGTGYHVEIDSGAIKDTAGNNFAGIADSTTWNFTTASAGGTPTLSYSTSTLNEARTFDGSINDKIIITLTGGDTFAGSTGDNLIAGSKASVSNVPAGLTAVLTRTSATTAELSFTGTATSNANTNDLSDISLVFDNSAFVGGNAASITGSTKSDLGINFGDPGSVGSTQTFTPNTGTTLGSSDASTALALDANWMIVGDDEASVLRVYSRTGGAAVAEWNFGTGLGTGTSEVDLEASTRIGDTLYFIGSHSNKKDGSEQVSREHLFAVTVSGSGANTQFTYDGKNNQLENALVAWDSSNAHGKGANYFGLSASSAVGVIPENVNGFSIEGMTASQDGTQLLLGFRAPQTDTSSRTKAVIIPVTLSGLITPGGTNTPTFGTAIELDLGGRGIRSIEKAVGGGYLILAGPSGSATPEVTHDFRLFRWDGTSNPATELNVNLDTLRDGTGGSFETIVDVLSTSQGTLVQLLQDNGDTVWPSKTLASKDLPVADQQFQGHWVSLGTDVTDTTAPTLVSSSPADDGTNVAVNADLVLKFDEGVKAGAGSFVIKKSSDNSVVETIATTDAKVTIAYNTVTINPTATLDQNTSYYLEASNTAIADHAGNPWAGLTGATAYDFSTIGSTSTPKVLITEVNSNSTGGDFFEIYNYGTTPIDLTGWKWDDSAANFSGSTALQATTLNAGATLIVVNTADAAAFRTAWGLSVSTAVIATGGPGLGNADGVALFDVTGQLVSGFNYKTTDITATDSSVIQPVSRADNAAVVAGHAGVSVGGSANAVSAVWDGQSTTAPKYTYAQAGQLGVVTQTSATNGVGSPGLSSTVITKIHDIQGSGATAALTGTLAIAGIVTRKFAGSTQLDGFYVQEEDTDADSNAATSEAIFVYDPNGKFTGAVGNKVQITGIAKEFTTGTSSSLTELDISTGAVLNLGASTLPSVTNVQLPVTTVSDLERYEGMLVNLSAVSGDLTVTENYQLGRYGQVVLAANGASNQSGTDARLDQYTQFNAPSVAGYAAYQTELAKRKIYLDDGSSSQNLDPTLFGRGGNSLSASNTLRSGDTVGSITGILDERFEGYRIQTTTGVNFTATNARPASPPTIGGTLKVASFNVLNYFNGDGAGGGFPTSRGAENTTEFTRQRDKTIQAILGSGADVLGLMELENDGYGSTSAIQDLVNGLNAVAGAGTYALVNPGVSLAADAITVGLIYKPSQVAPVGAAATLTTSAAFNLTQRQPLAQTFQQTSTSEKFTVVVNHFKSKGSSAGGAGDTDAIDGQGASNGTRTRQAQDLAAWLATNPTGTTDSDYLIIGDLNSYAKEDPVTTLANAGYNSVLPITSYSYVFDGQVGSLDHALATSSLAAQVTGAEKWHINADEPSVLDYNTDFKSAGQIISLYNADPYRSSDHDPVIVGLNLAIPTISIQATDGNAAEAGNDGGTFRISRSSGGSLALNVTYTVVGQASANDYTPSLTGTATIAANQSFVDVTVAPVDDNLVEGNETVILSLVDGIDYNLSANSSATVTIADNDTQPNPQPQPDPQPNPQPDPQPNPQPDPQPDPTPNPYNCGCEDLEKLVNDSQNGTISNGNPPNDLILGSDNNDLIFGEIGNDTILGMSGDDLIFGNQDRDMISGNKGDDTIFAGKDDDFVRGGQDNDLIFGDFGNDTVCGDLGNDTVFGMLGDDILLGNKGDDVLNGNQGKDTVCGGEGNDLARGGQDDDLVLGGSGDDTVYGDMGNDTISGCEGNDLLIGGKGRDVFVLAQGQGSDIITDFIVGEDLLGLTNNLTFGNLTITQESGNQAGNTLIRVTATNELLVSLIGVSAGSINASTIAII